MPLRQHALSEWLHFILSGRSILITPIVGDASFRRYFRVSVNQQTYIAMDAPPELEDCRPFVFIARALLRLGVQVPQVLAVNFEQGFLLLTDFGDRVYQRELNATNVNQLYIAALTSLNLIQVCPAIDDWPLPTFGVDEIWQELQLFKYWLLEQYLNIHLPESNLNTTFSFLLKAATEQPYCWVHRDYHSRNLMHLPDDQVGVLDFQDAVWGPVTYDAVSLLRDCYIAWPEEQVARWIEDCYWMARDNGLLGQHSLEQYLRWFDLMGLQRHLKATFIYARKYKRDGVALYLQYIPQGLAYILEVASRYPELKIFHACLVRHVVPRLSDLLQ